MWKVRRTVASSMHQLAVILGPEITSRDLLPVFSRFIKDLDEVRIGILQHMSEFLKVGIFSSILIISDRTRAQSRSRNYYFLTSVLLYFSIYI